jgi:hypothetical protein
MQYLRRLSVDPAVSYYAIEGEYESSVSRYVVSTPQSREICNRPELLGCEYTKALGSAMTAALQHAPFRPLIESHPSSRVCVLNFLRGGLNFDLRNALHAAFGLNTHSSAFMSSQRYRIDGRWQIMEDMYRKLQIPSNALILTGDVVATGVTVENGLQVLLDHLIDIGSSIIGLIFFTIGCHKLEKALARFDPLFRDAFPNYQGSHAIYIEGKLRLVDSRTDLRIGLPGTDLIRRDCLLSPELEASQYEQPSYPLERCAIYDAGSRAFDISGYVRDVLGYWQQVAELAEQGLTLAEALKERWPETEYQSRESFLEHKRSLWQGVDEALLEDLYNRYRWRWDQELKPRADTTTALSELCAERITTLKGMLK